MFSLDGMNTVTQSPVKHAQAWILMGALPSTLHSSSYVQTMAEVCAPSMAALQPCAITLVGRIKAVLSAEKATLG